MSSQSKAVPKEPKLMSQEDGRRLRALFEMATDGIITISNRGVIESVNRATCELFGYSAEEMCGKKVNMLMTSDDRHTHDGYIERYERTKKPHIIGIGREVRGQRKNGEVFSLRLAVSEVELDDKTIYTGILHDLTAMNEAKDRIERLNTVLETKVVERTAALKERERELKIALSKEQELNELKSRFLSMASHEFKTPLSSILSSVELIGMYTSTDQQPKRERHIERVVNAIEQLTEVLDDFLSISKLEQGEIKANPKKINVPAIIATSVETSEGQFKVEQKIELELADHPQQIISDPKLLRHILVNLLSNAAKYSPKGSTIKVLTEASKTSYTFSIIDQGIGIPLEDQEHLFSRFFRARNVENIKGTGLGLHIVEHYVKLLNGSISFVSSTDGSGSVFKVTLPISISQ